MTFVLVPVRGVSQGSRQNGDDDSLHCYSVRSFNHNVIMYTIWRMQQWSKGELCIFVIPFSNVICVSQELVYVLHANLLVCKLADIVTMDTE